jgi:hypothetical protein
VVDGHWIFDNQDGPSLNWMAISSDGVFYDDESHSALKSLRTKTIRLGSEEETKQLSYREIIQIFQFKHQYGMDIHPNSLQRIRKVLAAENVYSKEHHAVVMNGITDGITSLSHGVFRNHYLKFRIEAFLRKAFNAARDLNRFHEDMEKVGLLAKLRKDGIDVNRVLDEFRDYDSAGRSSFRTSRSELIDAGYSQTPDRAMAKGSAVRSEARAQIPAGMTPDEARELEIQRRQYRWWSRRIPPWSAREKRLLPKVIKALSDAKIPLRGGTIQMDKSVEGTLVVQKILGNPRTPSAVYAMALKIYGERGLPSDKRWVQALIDARLDPVEIFANEPGAIELRNMRLGRERVFPPQVQSQALNLGEGQSRAEVRESEIIMDKPLPAWATGQKEIRDLDQVIDTLASGDQDEFVSRAKERDKKTTARSSIAAQPGGLLTRSLTNLSREDSNDIAHNDWAVNKATLEAAAAASSRVSAPSGLSATMHGGFVFGEEPERAMSAQEKYGISRILAARPISDASPVRPKMRQTVRKAIENLKGKFTVVTDMADVAAFTDKQLEEFEVMAHLQPNVKFVFCNSQGRFLNVQAAKGQEPPLRIEQLQSELGADRIIIMESGIEDLSLNKGEKLINISKGTRRSGLGTRKGVFQFRYMAEETGLVPMALLYADQHEKPSEKGMMDLSMVSAELRMAIQEFQNSIVFARAA